MIENLTKKQEEMLEVYFKKYVKIGLSTERIEKDSVKKIINDFYTEILQKPVVPIKIFDSPLLCIIFINYFVQLKKNINDIISKDFSKEEMLKELKEKKLVYMNSYLFGSFDSYHFGFYDYMHEVLGINYDNYDKYQIYKQTLNFGQIYCLDEICVISEKPLVIHTNKHGLHADEKAALVYADGFSVYRLNGVAVSKEIVLTPANKLDPKIILTEQNAEVRKEIIKKIGIERVITELGAKSIEKSENGVYELLNFDCIDGTYRPYLKMLNPSTKNWHIEGVHPDCKTIDQARGFQHPFVPEKDWKKPNYKFIDPKRLT